MKDRQSLLESLSRSNDTEGSLMTLGIILLDIRDLLNRLIQPRRRLKIEPELKEEILRQQREAGK